MIRRAALPLSVLMLCACDSGGGPTPGGSAPGAKQPLQLDGGQVEYTETDAKQIIENTVAAMKDKEKARKEAYWVATLSGKTEDFDKVTKLDLEYRAVFRDKKTFEKLKSLKDSTARIKDDLVIRQVRLLYLAFLEGQIEPKLQEELTKKSNEIEQIFHTYRGKIDGKPVTSNDILEILQKEKSSAKRQKAWEASKGVGPLVAPKLVELAKLRNQAAKALGFATYYDLQLELNEIPAKLLSETMDELAKETDPAWKTLKADVDKRLAKRWGVKPDAMRPWHYEDPFFQEAPRVADVNLDKYFAKKDPVEMVRDTYNDLGQGEAAKAIIDKSDLKEKPGKIQHAYCEDFDRNGDVRILANVRPNAYWTATMLHEMGHGVYFKGWPQELTWLLRQPSHSITTEAAAMFFEEWATNPDWLEKYAGVSDKEAKRLEKPLFELNRLKKLSFMRWGLVMVNFEREFYKDPGQNLNKLWWDLVEKYQGVKRPEGREGAADWATKIHLVMAPVYYQNYVIANLFVSMMKHRLLVDVLRKTNPDARVFVGRGDIGDQFLGGMFMMGAKWHWTQMITSFAGEILTTKYFVDEWVNGKGIYGDDEKKTEGGAKPAAAGAKADAAAPKAPAKK
ncbi:MAG TPA: M2 family metallopeptidase [Polyangia bacterium]|jgi:peptidyl-dipeptidase A